jgi:hypothetical protein
MGCPYGWAMSRVPSSCDTGAGWRVFDFRAAARGAGFFWGVAQLAERLTVNQEVGGSNPPAPVV